MENKDFTRVGYPPLKILTKSNGIGRLTDTRCIDLWKNINPPYKSKLNYGLTFSLTSGNIRGSFSSPR
jgi:hypothetical protein